MTFQSTHCAVSATTPTAQIPELSTLWLRKLEQLSPCRPIHDLAVGACRAERCRTANSHQTKSSRTMTSAPRLSYDPASECNGKVTMRTLQAVPTPVLPLKSLATSRPNKTQHLQLVASEQRPPNPLDPLSIFRYIRRER